jgi:hypothetical protein
MLQKAGASSQVWEQRGRKKMYALALNNTNFYVFGTFDARLTASGHSRTAIIQAPLF